MKQEDIIRMARESGMAGFDGVVHAAFQLEAFAALVAAYEREACAEVVDKRLKTWASLAGKDKAYQWLQKLSAAIRARREHDQSTSTKLG